MAINFLNLAGIEGAEVVDMLSGEFWEGLEGDNNLEGLIWRNVDGTRINMDGSRCQSCRCKGGGCLTSGRSDGGLGIGVCSKFGGISRDFWEESRAKYRVLIKESIVIQMEDALGVGILKIFEGGSVEETEGNS